jgi:hypothetical protein
MTCSKPQKHSKKMRATSIAAYVELLGNGGLVQQQYDAYDCSTCAEEFRAWCKKRKKHT